jgi:hypothetical protein
MLPLVTYEMVRERNQERVARSLRKYWLRRADEEMPAPPVPAFRDADVIELIFGAACEVEDAIA